jgi:hypothetical protein
MRHASSALLLQIGYEKYRHLLCDLRFISQTSRDLLGDLRLVGPKFRGLLRGLFPSLPCPCITGPGAPPLGIPA